MDFFLFFGLELGSVGLYFRRYNSFLILLQESSISQNTRNFFQSGFLLGAQTWGQMSQEALIYITSIRRDPPELMKNTKKWGIRSSMPSPVYPKIWRISGSSSIMVDGNNKQLCIQFVFIIPKVKTRRLACKIKRSDAKTSCCLLS